MNIAEHFEALEWTETTVQVKVKPKGLFGKPETTTWPRYIGTSSDGKTALELIGSPDNIRSVTLLGEMVANAPADLEAIKRNGAYAAVCLAIVCPDWTGRDVWLAHEMPRLRQKHSVSIRKGDWTIGLKFENATLTLKAMRA